MLELFVSLTRAGILAFAFANLLHTSLVWRRWLCMAKRASAEAAPAPAACAQRGACFSSALPRPCACPWSSRRPQA